MASEERQWSWGNFPVPQAHLLVGLLGVVLGLVWPLNFAWDDVWVVTVGITLIAAGFSLMVWATAAAGRVKLTEPDRLITEGPYSISRHPMYVAWTLVYLGVASLLTSGWLLVLFPVLAVWVHLESGREERRMMGRFGSAYVAYQHRVRRYL
jgi:protein-S-isoprenylcysteine O-methyltransferase Ste14